LGENAVAALREALRPKPSLATGGMPAVLVPDATAALAALYAKPGFPTDSVVALCDFGASGTSVTLSDAASNFQRIGGTVRCPDFSGDQVDQAILKRLQFAFVGGNSDIAGTTPVGSLSRRLDECRRAKEQLSAATVTVIPAEMPGVGEDVRLSRTQLEDLISEPLDRFVTTVEEVLRDNQISASRLAAVATVGGGACIPLVTERLERRLHAPVVTTAHPVLSAAIGAAVIAEQQSSAHPPTRKGAVADAPTSLLDAGPTAIGAGAPIRIDPAAWAADVGAAAAGESIEDGAQLGTYRALAWSQDASSGAEPLPASG
jgi:molecular chaperone DnaK (HSP70)